MPDANYGAGFWFTGEQTDESELLFLRNRYYAPDLGVFPSLDPFEGLMDRPMSLNGYSWVEGNVPNQTDATGLTSFSDLACYAAAAPCIASLVFVPDNAAAIGFAIDFATCSAAVAVCGTAKLIDIVGDTLGHAAADLLSEILGAGTSPSEVQATDGADPFATPGAPPAPTIEAIPAPVAPSVAIPQGAPIPQGGENTRGSDWPRRLAEWCNQTGWCKWAIWELLRRLLQNIDPLVDPIDRSRPEEEGPCGKIYTNRDPSDLQYLADSVYVITQRPMTRRRGLENATAYLYVLTLAGQVRLGNVRQADRDGILLHHPDIVNGNAVAYAGEMRFYNNSVVRWDNRSGHYRPNPNQDQEESNCIKQVIEMSGWGPLPPQSWVSNN